MLFYQRLWRVAFGRDIVNFQANVSLRLVRFFFQHDEDNWSLHIFEVDLYPGLPMFFRTPQKFHSGTRRIYLRSRLLWLHSMMHGIFDSIFHACWILAVSLWGCDYILDMSFRWFLDFFLSFLCGSGFHKFRTHTVTKYSKVSSTHKTSVLKVASDLSELIFLSCGYLSRIQFHDISVKNALSFFSWQPLTF